MRVMMVDPLCSTLPYDKSLCAALAEAGHSVCLVACFPPGSDAWDVPSVQHFQIELEHVMRQTSHTGLRLRLFSAWRHVRYGVQIQAIAKLAREWKADVVHFQWCLTPMAELALLNRLGRNFKLVHTVHDINPFNGGAVSSYLTLGLDKLMRRFDHLIVHTDSGVDALLSRGFSKDRVSRVPHGPLGPANTSAPAYAKQSVEDKRVNFLLLGIMKPYKGIDILIEAASLLPKNLLSQCHFTIAGKEEMDVGELKELCRQKGVGEQFTFENRYIPDDELPSIFNRADVALFPYRSIEASGIFSIAIKYGKPIIASRLGVFKDTLVDGTHGYLVEPGDPTELSNAINRMIANREKRISMARNVEKLSGELPGWDKIAATLSKVYRR
jgi:glycosyltransferase involved in cell wall biosynthesis